MQSDTEQKLKEENEKIEEMKPLISGNVRSLCYSIRNTVFFIQTYSHRKSLDLNP